ncbi:hypothetical protein GCK32_014788 [Trichostrongylus colubriformis]|uniref:Uncharacterized protein n=1 Tax=Trichostrongylus colubriformis TaxID=6319 RepID=A0AAN8IEE5_TRICO
MRYGEPYPFDDRGVGGDLSLWARPCTQPDEMYKLESMLRRTVPESVSPLDAIRQVEKMGLTSVVGALLSAVDSSRNLGCATHQNPSRALLSMVDDPHTRRHPLPSDLDYSRSSTRDISKYVEPLEEFIDSSRISSTMGGGMANGVGGSGNSSYGQSYPAFAAQSFGGMLDYERYSSDSLNFAVLSLFRQNL